jgi:hypothetical protein
MKLLLDVIAGVTLWAAYAVLGLRYLRVMGG